MRQIKGGAEITHKIHWIHIEAISTYEKNYRSSLRCNIVSRLR